MESKSDWPYVALLLFFTFFLVYYAIGPYNLALDLDTDASGHIAKVYTLLSQMKAGGNPLYWGIWDWNHFAGYDFLRIYPSFSYLIWATVSLLTSVAPETVVKIWVFITLPIGGLFAFFYLRRREKIDAFVSLLGAFSYVTLPVILWYFVIHLGYVHVLLIFALLPMLAYFLDLEAPSAASFVGLTFVWALIALTHIVWFFNIAFFAMVFTFMKYYWMRNKQYLEHSVLSLVFALTVSSFSTFPVLFNLAEEASMVVKNGMSYNPIEQVVILAIFTNGMLIIELLYSLYAIKKRWEKFYPYASMILIASVLSVFPTTINDLIPIFGGSTLVAFLLFEPKFFAFVINSLRSNLKGVASGCILIALITLAVIPPLVARSNIPVLNMQRYFGAWDFLKKDEGWFRVETFPNHAFGSNLPFYTGHSTLTYWYIQGAPAGMKSYLQLAGQANEDFSRVIQKTDSFIKFLKYNGVKYVVIDGYFEEVARAFLNSSLVALVYEDAWDTIHPVRVFIIGNETEYKPLTITDAITPLNSTEEFYTQAIDASGYNYSVVYVENSVGQRTLNSSPNVLNWEVIQDLYRVNVNFNVSGESFVVLPFTYKPQKILVEVFPNDGVQLYRAHPGFIGLYVPKAGYYRIYIQVQESSFETLWYFVSLASPIILILYVGRTYIRERFAHRLGSLIRHEENKV